MSEELGAAIEASEKKSYKSLGRSDGIDKCKRGDKEPSPVSVNE